MHDVTWRESKKVTVTIGLAFTGLAIFAAVVRWMAAVESNQEYQKAGIAAQLDAQRDLREAIQRLSVEIGRMGEWHDSVNQRINRLEDRP